MPRAIKQGNWVNENLVPLPPPNSKKKETRKREIKKKKIAHLDFNVREVRCLNASPSQTRNLLHSPLSSISSSSSLGMPFLIPSGEAHSGTDAFFPPPPPPPHPTALQVRVRRRRWAGLTGSPRLRGGVSHQCPPGRRGVWDGWLPRFAGADPPLFFFSLLLSLVRFAPLNIHSFERRVFVLLSRSAWLAVTPVCGQRVRHRHSYGLIVFNNKPDCRILLLFNRLRWITFEFDINFILKLYIHVALSGIK